jgi:AAHS family 4-hydroxybenzoate transporter-like MFS transporter
MNWLPTLASEVGIPIRAAIISLALLNIGAIVGNLLLARIGDRRSPYAFTALFYGLGGASLAVLGTLIGSSIALIVLSLLGGFLAFGAQLSLTTITARLFDADIRSTAVGWALAMGRIGAALGPMLAGWGFARGMSIFAFMAVVGALFALAGLSMLALGRIAYTQRQGGFA